MGTPLEILRYRATLTVTIPESVVEANVGYLPWVLGENLAGQVDAWVMEQRLGYYPALDYFRERAAIVDPALLLLVDEVARYCVTLAEREIRRRLSRAFSRVQVEQVRSTAFAMPHVRPARSGAPADLARHYAPNRIRAELTVSSIRKGEYEGADRLVRQQIARWLKDAFEQVELGDMRPLTA